MASSKRVMLIMMAAIVALVVAPCLGEDYLVGDKDGWSLGVDYSAWAQGKAFRVGDNLVFSYSPGFHNVVVVNATDYTKCSASSSSSALTFMTGDDVIHLAAPGETGYICTFSEHCSNGMKLLINVSSSAADAPIPAPFSGPAPSPSSPKSSSSSSNYMPSMFAAVAMAAAVMI